MMRRSIWIPVLVLTSCAVAAGRAQDSVASGGWQSAAARVERSTLVDDAPGVKLGRADLLRLLAASPADSDAAMMRYAVAYADWRLSTLPTVPAREQNDLLDDAETQLKSALKLDAKFAEAWSLLSAVYGMKIAHSSIKGIVLGPRSSGAIDEAMKLDANNPRTLLSKGIGKFNAPGMFGGSEKEAEALLRQAIDRFGAEPNDKPFPAWGRFDAHAWLGQVLAKRGDKTGARAEYAKALEIAPQSHWITLVLIPALDKR